MILLPFFIIYNQVSLVKIQLIKIAAEKVHFSAAGLLTAASLWQTTAAAYT